MLKFNPVMSFTPRVADMTDSTRWAELGIVSTPEDAEAFFQKYPNVVRAMVCVSIPHAKLVTSAAEAYEFFNNKK